MIVTLWWTTAGISIFLNWTDWKIAYRKQNQLQHKYYIYSFANYK